MPAQLTLKLLEPHLQNVCTACASPCAVGVTTNLQAAGVEIKMARKTLENAGLFEDDVEVLRVERLLRQKEEEAQKRKTEAEAERCVVMSWKFFACRHSPASAMMRR